MHRTVIVLTVAVAVAALSAAALGVATAQVSIVSSAGLEAETFSEAPVPDGAFGVIAGGLRGSPTPWSDLIEAGGWHVVGLRWDDPSDAAPGHTVASDRDGAGRTVAMHEVDGQRLAFVSVSVAPPDRDVPQLEDAEAAVRHALAEVADGVPVVAVVAGGREAAAALLRSVPRLALAIVAGAGSGDPAPLRIGDAWLVEAPWGGAHWGVTTARVEGERLTALEHRFEVPQGASQAVADAKRRHGLAVAPLEALMRALPEAPGASTWTEASVDQVHVVGNRAARVTVHGMSVFERYADLDRRRGGPHLVLDVEAENTIPMALVREQEVPTEYRFQDLSDHVYVVVDGTRVARLAPDAEDAPGHLSVRGFRLERLGDRVRGNLAFALPPGAFESLELRIYDFAHGHVRVPLVPAPDGWQPGEPVLPLAVNEIVEMGVFDVLVADTLDGRSARGGMTFVSVELRGRSMFTFETDATAFDPQARAGDTTEVGTVADWLEAHRYLHLVVDGEYGYAPDPDATTLPVEPRLLPDVMTGGRVVFEVPAGFASLVLRADFPNARMPDRSVIRPQPVRVELHGDAVAAPERNALWAVRDDTLEVAITGRHAADAFAGSDAGSGQRFLVLDVTVRNAGERPEFFQTAEQLHYVDARGRQSPPHELTFQAPYRPTRHVWVPDGEQRSFQVAFLVDATEARPRVSYRGFTLAEIVELPPLDE